MPNETTAKSHTTGTEATVENDPVTKTKTRKVKRKDSVSVMKKEKAQALGLRVVNVKPNKLKYGNGAVEQVHQHAIG